MMRASMVSWPWLLLVAAAPDAAAGERAEGLADWVRSATAVEAMAHLRADLIASVSGTSRVQPSVVIPWPGKRRGLFVSLLEGERVVGCMGSFAPPRDDVYAAALSTAVRATREDIRHPPLDVDDIGRSRIVVTFVESPEPLPDRDALHPWQEGLLAVQGSRSAVVVPGEAKTTRYAVALALKQSGINPDEPIDYYRFKAFTWREETTRKR